jgi:Ca2+-binding RTX toxin-like protein
MGALASLALLGASAAIAATILGTDNPDNLTGTPRADVVDARAGNDTVNARAGRDRVFGGLGDDTLNGGFGRDRVRGGDGNDTVNGNRGRDLMSGGKGDDTQHGGPGADLIFANRGADTTVGDNGNDVLWALAKADVAFPGDPSGDKLDGGDGNDRFRVRDGEIDQVTCGDGFDRVLADQFDLITDATPSDPTGSCEVVTRRDASTVSDREENRFESPSDDAEEK